MLRLPFLLMTGLTSLDLSLSNSSDDSFFPATPRTPCLPR